MHRDRGRSGLMMPAPLGYTHIKDRGVRGWVARWWFERRCRRVRRALAARRK